MVDRPYGIAMSTWRHCQWHCEANEVIQMAIFNVSLQKQLLLRVSKFTLKSLIFFWI